MGARMERWNNSASGGSGRGSWLFHLLFHDGGTVEQKEG
jgi:hypothetical protein